MPSGRIDRFNARRAGGDAERDELVRRFDAFFSEQLGPHERIDATLWHVHSKWRPRRAFGLVVTDQRLMFIQCSCVGTSRIRGYYTPSEVRDTYQRASVYVAEYAPGRAGDDGSPSGPARLVLQLPLGPETFTIHDRRRWYQAAVVADALGGRTSIGLDCIGRQLTPGTPFKAYDASRQVRDAIVVHCDGTHITYTVDDGRPVTAPIFEVLVKITLPAQTD